MNKHKRIPILPAHKCDDGGIGVFVVVVVVVVVVCLWHRCVFAIGECVLVRGVVGDAVEDLFVVSVYLD